MESKYSDVLGRRRRKDQQEKEDRDKTLEPEQPSFMNPLSRSSTTILSSTGASAKKERTPYRLNRNLSDRKPTNTTSSYMSKTRPELSLLHGSSSAAIPKTSYYESPVLRHKDSLYDAYNSSYNSRVPKSRYNDYDHVGLSSGSGTYGYYDGRDKENTFKSKYEPSRLYAELNNNNNTDSFAGRDRDRNKRFQKTYRRTATTGNDASRPGTSFCDYDDDLLSPSTSSGMGTSAPSTSRYLPRKSLGGYQRSQTQKFFDSEKSSVLRSLNNNDANNNSIDLYGDEMKTEAMREREARRKEIQGLIAKYAQIDDVYNRAIDNEPNNNFNSLTNNDNISVLDSKPTDLLTSSNALGLGLSNAHTTSTFLPLSKTQSVSSMSSVNRSRIPKTYSTFVRNILYMMFSLNRTIYFVFSYE